MKRDLYTPEQEDYRASFRRFLEREVIPHYAGWEAEGIVPREMFAAAAQHGFVAMAVPERFGGAAVDDFRFNAVLCEEIQRAGVGSYGLGLTLHNDICLPYFLSYCDESQQQRWLPGIADGRLICAIAMTEPGIGSDLAGMQASARAVDGGFRLNGTKTFITNGINADLVIVAAKTDPKQKHAGISLVIVERGAEGFDRGRNLEKVGQHAQDTAELFFNDVFVPSENLLGETGQGFRYLVSNLAQERLSIAISALAAARAGLDWTLDYARERRAFGQAIGSFQNSRFQLAECRAEVDVAQAYVDDAVRALGAGELTAEDAAIAKWWCTEAQGRVLDRCVQLHGGYGYMTEYPVARAWVDARVTRIYGGANEIMREIVGRSMGL
ncbi:MAG: acyl-CoA dehydrogenase family protein [Solirubrobacteraceae bacterium]